MPTTLNPPSHLLIAGVPVELHNAHGGSGVPELLLPFAVQEPSRVGVSLTVHLLTGTPPELPTGPVVRNGTTIAMSRGGDFWLRDRHGSVAHATRKLSNWHCWSLPDEQCTEIFPGNRWLMLALWGYLTLRGGAYLHGAVCVMEGRYVLFLGDSGVGKSTLSALVVAAGGTCLTDENPFVTPGEVGRPLVHGSARPGVSGSPAPLSAPLDAVFFLRHARCNELHRLDAAAAGRRLLGNARFFHWLPETLPLTMTMLDVIASATPVFDLGFVPDSTAVKIVTKSLDLIAGAGVTSR